MTDITSEQPGSAGTDAVGSPSPPEPGPTPDGRAHDGQAHDLPARGRAGFRPLIITGVIALVAAIALFTVLFGGSTKTRSFDQLAFVTADGSTATLADHRGEPLVVNFFASWCAPCRAELPAIEKINQQAAGRVQVLGINSDLDQSTWRSFVAQTDITYPTVFQSDQSIWTALDLSFMPSTVLINPDGTVAFKYTGLITEDKLRGLINEHFAVELGSR